MGQCATRPDGRSRGIARWLLLVVAIACPAGAATIVVPVGQPTIQAAVDAAAAGDTIFVQPGTYAENVHIANDRHGLVIAAADESGPPVLVATGAKREVGILIDGADDVTIHALTIRGPSEGLRLTDSHGARLTGLRIEDAGVAIRVQGGALVQIDDCEIVGTRVGQGIRIDRSRDVLVTDVTIEGTRREGVLVRAAPRATMVRVEVTDARGRDGIKVTRSPDAALVGCTATGNRRDGIHVQHSPRLVLRDNVANRNVRTGLWIERSLPFFSVDDLVGDGNHARANVRRNMLVKPPRCGRRRCARPTTTTAPRTSTSTTVTTTTAPSSVPETTPTTTRVTTTSATTTTRPPATPRWRLYVHIARGESSAIDVDVPYRSPDAPLVIAIRPDHLSAFQIGDQVTVTEIAALGGDTLERFEDAAASYIVAHPTDYPGFTEVMELRWAKRVQ